MSACPLGSNILTVGPSGHWLCVNYPIANPKTPYQEVESAIDYLEDTPSSGDGPSFEDNWEILGDKLNTSVSDDHSKRLARIFPGVNMSSVSTSAYNGECALCLSRLTPDDAALDFYDGNLYCSNCHQGQEATIPRDVIECWDFTLKPVSFATKKFLDSVSSYPPINIALINPSLFACIPELASLRKMRRTLSLLWCLISRCSQSTSNRLVSALKHRSYMLGSVETIDKYSLKDLRDVHNGSLGEFIQTTVSQFFLTHAASCSGCRAWLSLCDICRDVSRPIWPHTFAHFRRCATPGCRRVMHLDCLPTKYETKVATAVLSRTVNGPNTDGLGATDSNSTEKLGLATEEIELLPRCTPCKNNLRVIQAVFFCK